MSLENKSLTEESAVSQQIFYKSTTFPVYTVYLSTICPQQLRQDLEEKFYAGLFSWGDASAHDVAAVMKQFLRELPIPLLSYQYLDAFPQVSSECIDIFFVPFVLFTD